jgi:prepilin-type N-terminal cleavage/methylation domain-containing protein
VILDLAPGLPSPCRDRRGFTLIELLTVLIVMGVLASIALLKYFDLKDQARTAQVNGDFAVVRIADMGYWAETNKHPVEVGPGVVPPELVQYLPNGFKFDHAGEGYVLDYDNLGPGGGYQVGITVTATNNHMSAVLERVFGHQSPFFRSGNALTYILVGPDGAM